MQPDRPNNYWKKEPDEVESDNITDMYTPTPTNNDSAQTKKEVESDSKKQLASDEFVHWSAVEYINGEKNWLWFTAFAIIALLLIAADIFFIHSYTFSALVVVIVIAIIVFSLRPARMINYTLSGDQGLYIGEKLYHFSEFKAFGLVRDHGQHSIMLIPTKRFSLGVSVYFPEESGEQIVDILGARLPMENLKLDIVDIIVQKLRL
jgi:hypothetical protein